MRIAFHLAEEKAMVTNNVSVHYLAFQGGCAVIQHRLGSQTGLKADLGKWLGRGPGKLARQMKLVNAEHIDDKSANFHESR